MPANSASKPLEWQRLYGADLPPSLRRGAVLPGADRPREESVPRIEPLAESQRYGTRYGVAAHSPYLEHFERERRPYALTGSRADREPPRLKNEPSFALYRKRSRGPRDRLRLEDERGGENRRLKENVVDAFHIPLKLKDDRTRAVAKAVLNKTRVGRARSKQATVDEGEEDANEGALPNSRAGAPRKEQDRRDETQPWGGNRGRARSESEAREPRSRWNDLIDEGHRETLEDEKRRMEVERMRKEREEMANRAAAEAEHKIQDEMRKRLSILGYTDATIDIMLDKDNARKLREQTELDTKIEERVRARLRGLGIPEATVRGAMEDGQRKQNEWAREEPRPFQPFSRKPEYPKIHRDYLAVETLKYYDLPWEYDRVNPDFIIILREMDKPETDVLFEHTARLRRGGERLTQSASRLERKSKSMYDTLSPSYVFFRHPNDGEQEGIIELDPDRASGISSSNASAVDGKSPWYEQEGSINSEELQDVEPSDAGLKRRKRQPFFRGSRTAVDKERPTVWQHSAKKESVTGLQPLFRRTARATYGDILRELSSKPPRLQRLPMGGKEPDGATFHLIHFQQNELDFEQFKLSILENIRESNMMWNDVNEHLNQTQCRYERLPQKGNPTRYLEEFCFRTTSAHGLDILTACVPFFELREHRHRTDASTNIGLTLHRLWRAPPEQSASDSKSRAASETVHATRTLFQSLNPRNNSRRDLKQAVCHMLEAKDRRYLHLSQVWFLIINEELIITCSVLSESQLYGDLWQHSSRSDAGPSDTALLTVDLKTPDAKTWLFTQADCTSYLDFVAHFSDITTHFADDFFVLLDREEVHPYEWEEKIGQAKRSNLHLELKKKKYSRRDVGSHSPRIETPITRAVYDRLATKFFHRQKRSFVADAAEDGDVANDGDPSTEPSPRSAIEKEPDVSVAYDSSVHASPSKTQHDHPVRTERVAHSDSSVESPGSGSSRSIVMSLPKSFAPPDVLRRLGVEFREADKEIILLDDLDKGQLQEILETACILKPNELRLFTCEVLAAALNKEQESVATAQPLHTLVGSADTAEASDHFRLPDLGLFEEHLLYDTCRSTSSSKFIAELSWWSSKEESNDVNASASSDSGVNTKELQAFCEALGYKGDEEQNAMTGSDIEITPLDGWLYSDLLNGLRCILKLYPLAAMDSDLQEERGKLFTAILTLVKTLDNTLKTAPTKIYIFVIRRTSRAMARLFNVVKEFELYSITGRTMLATSLIQPSEINDQLKHIATALLLLSKTSMELTSVVPSLEAEMEYGKTSLATVTIGSRDILDYSHVRDCYDQINRLAVTTDKLSKNIDSFERHDPSQLQQKFDEQVEQLELLGREEVSARNVLANECRWRRIEHHANAAFESLLTSFDTMLKSNESAKIQYKAAALPTDIMALLLPQILWRPVIGDQDALDMYMQYITDLESNILTGDPSREPLERIRNLRHELNAFSQLQTRQIDVLEQMTSTLFPASLTASKASFALHPRRPIFEALPESVRIQNTVVQELGGMLNSLQNEARAQISSVQDWRDNAAVVFTTITIIFLPLSFVSSVFGMNTSDVRNMNLNQWVFWASAAPFSILVILITVYLVDVPPLWRWLERKGNGTGEEATKVDRRREAREGTTWKFLAGIARGKMEMRSREGDVDGGIIAMGKDGDDGSDTDGIDVRSWV